MRTAFRDVGSTEVQFRPGPPALRANNDCCYLPGNSVDDYRPWKAGKLVPAGSDMILSLHYTTNGKAVVDRTKIGFTVAKTPPLKKFVMQQAGEDTPVTVSSEASSKARFSSTYNPSFAIPPNDGDYRAPPMDITFLKDVELVRLRPHAHLRGKSHRVRRLVSYRRYSCVLRPLRYSINVTLDGCCDHGAIPPDEDLHRHAIENLNQADALLFGRVIYEMMEAAWRPPAATVGRPDWMEPFARTINAAKKYVVSSTLDRVDWNADLVRGDLGTAVRQLKREPGTGLFTAGVKLPLALAELGLIDEYEFVVHPRLTGHGPTLFAGLSKYVDLRLVGRLEFSSGAVAMRYEPRR